MITIHVNSDGEPTHVYYRGGFHSFDIEADALQFVARIQLDRPNTQVKVEAR